MESILPGTNTQPRFDEGQRNYVIEHIAVKVTETVTAYGWYSDDTLFDKVMKEKARCGSMLQ